MKREILKQFFFLLSFLSIISLPTVMAAAPPACRWQGYATVNGANVNSSHTITSYTNGSSATNATIFSSGFYVVDVPGSTGYNITFKICGVYVNQTYQNFSCGGVGYNALNLTMNTSSTSTTCTYACGCTSGYCVDGYCCNSACSDDNYDCNVAGSEGTCTSTGTTTTTSGGGGPGSGVPGTTTSTTTTTIIATTTTTTLPPVTESENISSIPANTNATFSYESQPITSINVEVNNAVSNTQITIVKQSTAPASVSIAAPGTTYAYFTITKSNIQDADVKAVKIRFKVERSWVTSNNVNVSTIALNRYADGQWTKMPTTKLSEDNDYIYFEAETTGLSVFAVAGQSITTTTTTLPTTTTTLPAAAVGLPIEFIVIIILVVVVILIFVFRKTLTSKKKIVLPPSV